MVLKLVAWVALRRPRAVVDLRIYSCWTCDVLEESTAVKTVGALILDC